MNSFRTFIVGVALAAIAGQAGLRADDASEAKRVVERWIDGQKDLNSLTIEFRQERLLKGLKKPVASKGMIWLDKRGLMRWQVGEPPKTIAVYRDKEVMVSQPAKKLVERRTLGKEGGNQGEMEKAFLESGIPRSLADFEKFFRILGVEKEGQMDRLQLEVKDSRAQSALVSMSFLIDPASNLLAGYDVAFRDGSSIRTRFEQVKKNAVMEDSLFNPDTTGYRVEELKP